MFNNDIEEKSLAIKFDGRKERLATEYMIESQLWFLVVMHHSKVSLVVRTKGAMEWCRESQSNLCYNEKNSVGSAPLPKHGIVW